MATNAGPGPRIWWAVAIGFAAVALARDPSQVPPAELVQAWLGMKLEDQNLRFQGRLRLQVVVREVKTDGPAAKAGVQPGDIVVFVEDQLVSRTLDVMKVLRHTAPGSLVSVDLLRAGRPVMVALRRAGA